MNDDYISWMKRALFLAQKAASENEVPVGALVLFNHQIIGEGYNQREKSQNPLAHAELSAIQQAAETIKSWRLSDCILVVTLEPCPMCLAASQQARIQKVLYGAKDPKGGALSLGYSLHQDTRTHHRFSVEYLNVPECGHILTEFFSKKRTVKIHSSWS